MRKSQYVWLLMIGLGELLIGAGLISFATGREVPAEDDCAARMGRPRE
jgi:hypothetical protein